MRRQQRRLRRQFLVLAGVVVLGWAAADGAIGEVAPALVHPIERVYPLVSMDAANRTPSAEDWARAFPGEKFFANGVMEPEDARTVFRMLAGRERLYVRVECVRPEAGNKRGSVEFYVTQSGKPDFPCVAVVVKEGGENLVGLVRRARTWWIAPEAFPLNETVIPRKVSAMKDGWKLDFSLPFEELDIPREGFRFNVVRGQGLVGIAGERFAWCDLGGRMHCTSNQFDLYATGMPADKIGFPGNALRLPARLSVGLNRLFLEKNDADARLRIGDHVLMPHGGAFDVIVRDRGPLDMRLTDGNGKTIGTYHADVRRPLIIDAKERSLPADAKEFNLDIALDVAVEEPLGIVFTCRRGGGPAAEHEKSLTPGDHSVTLPVPAGNGGEVRVTARTSVPLPGGAAPPELKALHWFNVGVTWDDLNVYREDIRSLPTDRLCWAIIADALPIVLLEQGGDGQYARSGNKAIDLWYQMRVYVPALLYKTDHPDNPFFGDRRLLDSAIMGMEYALRPEIRMNEYGFPDSSRQGYLLTYDLLQDNIESERRAYWAEELQHLADAEVGRFLRTITDKYAFYSIDCETSTNHMAYHVADVYLAGLLFDRQDWKELGTTLMRRLARHGRDGYFEEQRGSPVNHYTWMTADALGEYYEWSNDAEVLPALEACARYMTAIATPRGGVMALHDSRNSHKWANGFGEYVPSLTPEGRRAARAVILSRMGEKPSNLGGRGFFRMAENAAYFRTGEETDVFGNDSEHPFPYGIIVRKDGFQYGLSTVARGAVSGNFVLDAQNVIEMFHKDAGCILNGGNSQAQPEAGNFWRKLDEPDWEGKTVGTSNDYLPHAALLSAIPGGHELGLGYRTFEGDIVVQVFSPNRARLEAFVSCDKGPVTFSFFPGAVEGEKIVFEPDEKTLRFRGVTLRANMPFRLQKGFRILNPYNMQYQYAHKPVRCWLDLNEGTRFILDIAVASE